MMQARQGRLCEVPDDHIWGPRGGRRLLRPPAASFVFLGLLLVTASGARQRAAGPAYNKALDKVKHMIVRTIASSQDQLNELKKEADFCKEQMEETEEKLKKHKESAKKARDAYEDAKATNQEVLDAELAAEKTAAGMTLLLRKQRSPAAFQNQTAANQTSNQTATHQTNQTKRVANGSVSSSVPNFLSASEAKMAPAVVEVLKSLRTAGEGEKVQAKYQKELSKEDNDVTGVMKEMREQTAKTQAMGDARNKADEPYEPPEKPMTKTEKAVLNRKKELEKEDAQLDNTQKEFDTLYNRCVAMGPSREEAAKRRKESREKEIENLKDAHELLDNYKP